MFGARAFTAFALACALVPAVPAGGGAAAPVPLDYKAYDGWSAPRGMVVSDDGTNAAYALTPEDGDPTLVVRSLEHGGERREARGSAPAFAAAGRFVVFTRLALKTQLDAAKRAKKPEAEQPKNDLGLLDLRAAGPAEIVSGVRSVVVAKNGGPVIAYRTEPTPAPSGSPAPAPAATASGSPQPRPTGPPTGEPVPQGAGAAFPLPTPSASASPLADKTKATGSPLTIRDLTGERRLRVADVTEYVVADDDSAVAYVTQTKAGKTDGVHVYDVATGSVRELAAGDGRYRKLAIARDGSSVAYVSDAATYASAFPHDELFVAGLREKTPVVRSVDAGSAGLAADSAPSANGTIAFSRDGRRVFFGTAALPTPRTSATPEPMKVDLWTWHDPVLQSVQRHEAETERKRTYLAVYDVAAARAAQLGSPSVRDVVHNENADVALGFDARPYAKSASWIGNEYVDVYAISLHDGGRRLLARRVDPANLSPDGRNALVWDERTRHWWSLDTRDGRRVELAARLAGFADERDDHPAPPPPFGTGGWLSDGGVVLYDRYDAWRADPRDGSAKALTAGDGARRHVVYSTLQTDPDADALRADRPLLLAAIEEKAQDSGFSRVAATGGVPQTLLRAPALVNEPSRDIYEPLHNRVKPPLVARSADRALFWESTFRAFPDYYAADLTFAHPERITDANPQQAHYRWGTERLINYRAKDGTPLRAIMLVPDGLARNRRAPLLMVFYERWSDTLHSYYMPGPGTSPNVMRYVSNGYVVVLPDVAYKSGRPGPSAENCLLPALDAALATGYVDPARAGIAGHSWAAYQINYLITRTQRFRAVEAGAAVDNMFGAYAGIRLESGNVRESQYEHGQSRIGATPWDRPDLYLQNSGLFRIRNIHTPYLTIHNDLDGAVPQAQGIEFITAMRRLGKEAYLFSFDGEDHNLRGREQQKYWTVHLDEWFDYWLKGAPRPGWMDGVDFLHRGERNVRPLYGESD